MVSMLPIYVYLHIYYFGKLHLQQRGVKTWQPKVPRPGIDLNREGFGFWALCPTPPCCQSSGGDALLGAECKERSL